MAIPQYEGLCNLAAVTGSGAFFNTLQVLQRDLSVMCLNVHLGQDGSDGSNKISQISILDAMCGGGIRAVRYALEVAEVKETIAVDLDPCSAETARQTAHLSSANVKIQNDDCNRVMSEMMNHFDVIDLDPCGSPSPFLLNAIQSIKVGGLLCIASTEDPSIDPILCRSRYNGKCFNREMNNIVGMGCAGEIYIRLLLGKIMQLADNVGRVAIPLLSLNLQFFRRVYIRIENKINLSNNINHLSKTIPYVYLRANEKKTSNQAAWEMISQQQHLEENKSHIDGTNIAGPLYGGSLHSHTFVSKLWTLIRLQSEVSSSISSSSTSMNANRFALVKKVKSFSSLIRLESLLRLVFSESKISEQAILKSSSASSINITKNFMNSHSKRKFDEGGHHGANNQDDGEKNDDSSEHIRNIYNLDVLLGCHEPCGKAVSTQSLSLTDDQWKLVIKELKKDNEGYFATRSHIDPLALKSNAPYSLMVEAVQKVKKLNPSSLKKQTNSCHIDDTDANEGGANSKSLVSKLTSSGVLNVITVNDDSQPNHIIKALSSPNITRPLGVDILPDWLKQTQYPKPRGLPTAIVNADVLDALELRLAIRDLLCSSDHLNPQRSAQQVDSSGLWTPAGDKKARANAKVLLKNMKDAVKDDDEEVELEDEVQLEIDFDYEYRKQGKCRQVIVVGEGANLAVRKGAGLHLLEVDRAAALHEFSAGGKDLVSDMNDIQSNVNNQITHQSHHVGFDKRVDSDFLIPVEGVDDLETAIRRLKPYGVLVLRSGRYRASCSSMPPIVTEGALIIGDDTWGAIVSSQQFMNSDINKQANKKQKQNQKECSSKKGEDNVGDTLTIMATSVGLCGLIIEAPPPPISGHAVCVTGGRASATLEGCLLRGPTVASPDQSTNVPFTGFHKISNTGGGGGGGNKKQRKSNVRSSSNGSGATLRGCVCAADGAFLRLVRCFIRGGFGERSRKLVAAAAEAAANKARGIMMSSIKSTNSNFSSSALSSTTLSMPPFVSTKRQQSNEIGGSGAGMPIGGAGIFIVGKAVCEMEGGMVDGCKGAGIEARQGGRLFLHGGGGVAYVTHCGGPGVLSQSFGAATLRGPGVGVIGCLGEGSLVVGNNASLESTNSITVSNSRGHGLLAHNGASVVIDKTHFDDLKQCGLCCRGDGTMITVGNVVISRARQAFISCGDRGRVAVQPGIVFVGTSSNASPSFSSTSPSAALSLLEQSSNGRIEEALED